MPGASEPRILVAEGEPTVGQLIREALKLAGHEVELSENGRDALRRYQKGEFDLLVIDSMLPRRSGLEVVTQIRNSGDAVPIILTSAGAGRVESFAFTYRVELLHKPFGLKELRAAVARALRETGR
jgi:two-component system response regulator QseB